MRRELKVVVVALFCFLLSALFLFLNGPTQAQSEGICCRRAKVWNYESILTECHKKDNRSHVINHAEVDDSFIPGLEDEKFEVQYLTGEPKSHIVSADGILSCRKWDSEKHFKTDDLSSEFDYGWKMNFGALDYGERDDLKLEVLDELLYNIDEVDGIHGAHDLSNSHEDLLLDIELPEKFPELDYGPFEDPELGASGSESGTPESSGSCNSLAGISESPAAKILGSDCNDGPSEGTANTKLHQDFGSVDQVPGVDVLYPAGCDMPDYDEKPSANLKLSIKKVKCSVKATKCGSPNRQKRLRKPTQRYIDDFSKTGPSTSTAKCLKVKFPVQHHPVPSESWVLREHRKNDAAILESESDYQLSTSDSEEDCKRMRISKAYDRRKHQKMWTLPEVMKLVDGISQFGVGRWTSIKRQLFKSSDYRTPIDLRDKWRNLLRSSYSYANNRKVKADGNHSPAPLPQHLAHRICELADAHPYPGVRGSKKSKKSSSAARDLPFSTSMRNLRRRKRSWGDV